jgi:hypothetical protein
LKNRPLDPRKTFDILPHCSFARHNLGGKMRAVHARTTPQFTDIVDDVSDIVDDISDLVKDSSTFVTTFMLLVPEQFFSPSYLLTFSPSHLPSFPAGGRKVGTGKKS